MKRLMAEAPLETKIHFEFASFVDNSTLSEIKKNILPYTDSIGMNEQEQRFVIKRKISIHYTNYRCFQLYVKKQRDGKFYYVDMDFHVYYRLINDLGQTDYSNNPLNQER